MPPDDRARQLGRSWAAAADRQLELATTAFEYTHNIDRLLTRQPDHIRDALGAVLPVRLRQELTDGATVARYPGGPSYTKEESQLAVDAAGAVRRALRNAKPDLFGGIT